MSKLIILATALAAFAMLPAFAAPNHMWYFADVGSGGTRFVAQWENRITHELTPCCTDGECQTETSDRTKTCAATGKRFGESSTQEQVAQCLKHQLEDLLEKVNKDSVQFMTDTPNDIVPRKCYTAGSLGQNVTMAQLVKNVLNSNGIILGATAGARRVEANTAKSFNELMIGGIQSGLQLLKDEYYPNVPEIVVKPNAVRGGILPGTMEAYFGLLAGKELYTRTNGGIDKNDFVFIEVGGASQQVGWFPDADAPAEVGLQELSMGPSLKPTPRTLSFKATHASLRATTRTTQTALKGDTHMRIMNNGNEVRSWGSSILGDGGERFMVKILKHAVTKNAGKSACLRKGIEIGCKDATCKELAIIAPKIGSFKAAAEALQVPAIKTWVVQDKKKITGIGDPSGDSCYGEAKAVFAQFPDETKGEIPHWKGMAGCVGDPAACKTMKSIIVHRDHAALKLEKPGYFTAATQKRLNVVVSSMALKNSAHSKGFFKDGAEHGVTYGAFVAEAQKNCKAAYEETPFTRTLNKEDAYSFADCMAISELRCLIELVVKGDFTTPQEDPFMGRLFLGAPSWVVKQSTFEVNKEGVLASKGLKPNNENTFSKVNTLINELKPLSDSEKR